MAGLALVGMAISIYLTYLDLSGSQTAFCSEGSGCDLVRASAYSRLLGIPVAIIGAVGYAIILAVALLPLSARNQRLFLYVLSLAGFSFAAYLTYREVFTIRAICPYCVASAGVMTAILAVLLAWRPVVPGYTTRGLLSLSGLVVAIVLLGSALLPTRIVPGELPGDDFRVALAKHLTATGSVVYGAYWCPRCQEQKDMFGAAFRYVSYVECDPLGKDARPLLCQSKGIRGYPTWEIGGVMYAGTRPLDELARLSGFSR